MQFTAKNGTKLNLQANCLYVDLDMPVSVPEEFRFRTLHEAADMILDGSKDCPSSIYIEPNVYQMHGTPTKQGLILRCNWLSLIGLCVDAEDVILADNRGHMVNSYPANQSHSSPAHTLLIEGEGFHAENITIGNYCNLDLIYKRDSSKNQPRFSETITQAYAIGGYDYEKWSFKNCGIIGMLDTISTHLNRVYYNNCTIKGTKDFIGGAESAVFEDCTIIICDTCPMYTSGAVAALYKNCSFDVTLEDFDTLYITKFGGQVILNHCDFTGNLNYIEWALEPEDDMRCFVKDVTLNHVPVVIGSSKPENTVLITDEMEPSLDVYNILHGTDGWNPGNKPITPIAPIRITVKGRKTIEYQEELNVSCELYPFLPISQLQINTEGPISYRIFENQILICGTNTNEEAKTARITLSYRGVPGVYSLISKPTPLSQPDFIVPPYININNQQAFLDYTLNVCNNQDSHIELNDMDRVADSSIITWYRVSYNKEEQIAVSRTSPCKSYRLLPGDIGSKLKVIIYPMNHRSLPIKSATIYSREITSSDIECCDISIQDFAAFSTTSGQRQKGSFHIDAYRPTYLGVEVDNVSAWEAGNPNEAFQYGRGRDGAKHSFGLLTSARGCCLQYTAPDAVNDMVLTAVICPEKDTGEGFGSANGQYMEFLIKYDINTKTGYGLRIERVPANAVSCSFSLRKYINGVNSLLSEELSASVFLTPCKIVLSAKCGMLTADASTSIPQMIRAQKCGLSHIVHLDASIPMTLSGDVEIHHTGTVPVGNRSLIESLSIQYLN